MVITDDALPRGVALTVGFRALLWARKGALFYQGPLRGPKSRLSLRPAWARAQASRLPHTFPRGETPPESRPTVQREKSKEPADAETSPPAAVHALSVPPAPSRLSPRHELTPVSPLRSPPPKRTIFLCLPMGTGLVFGVGTKREGEAGTGVWPGGRGRAAPVWRKPSEEETGWACECLTMTSIRKL